MTDRQCVAPTAATERTRPSAYRAGLREAASDKLGSRRTMRTGLVVGITLCVALTSARTDAQPIGTYNQATHDHAEITFRFNPVGGSAPELILGLGGSIPLGGVLGCQCELYDEGGLISDSIIMSILGCQGNWQSGSLANSLTIDTNVDLSGLQAGEQGRIVLRPIFTPVTAGIFNFSAPSLFLDSSQAASIESRLVEIIPEPTSGLLTGLLLLLPLRSRRR